MATIDFTNLLTVGLNTSVFTKMLTRRDKLLNRPWQLRRYNNHRKKVLTALPAIDFGPPPERQHVTCKLKKLQKEGERRNKIEADNFKLLQRMGEIMKKNRLENHWETPLPKFLHRVGIYHRTRSPTPFQELPDTQESTPIPAKRKSCSACTPLPQKQPTVPEERVPWLPPRPRISRRRSSSLSVKPHSEFDFPVPDKRQNQRSRTATSAPKSDITPLPTRHRSLSSCHVRHKETSGSESRLILKQGALHLSVNFPPDAEIEIFSGNLEKPLLKSSDCKTVLNSTD